jgi:hypothetical protein
MGGYNITLISDKINFFLSEELIFRELAEKKEKPLLFFKEFPNFAAPKYHPRSVAR